MRTPDLKPTTRSPAHDGARHSVQRLKALTDWRSPGAPPTDRVLVVEDEMEALNAAVAVFERAGYAVLSATCGMEAIELMRLTSDIQLLFADVLMPDIDGASVGREARRLIPGIRVVLVSGFPDHVMNVHGGEPGEFPFLMKPFTMAEVALLLGR
jgi:DNA-binding NtrC family response regulator